MTQHAGRFARARAATAVGLTLALSLTLSGCISGAQPGAAPAQSGDAYSGEIEWWTINLQKNYADYVNGLIETYEAQHPEVTITWVDVPGQDVTTKLLASIASGDVPDAVNITSAVTGLFDDSMADLHDHFDAEELAAYAPGLVAPLEASDGRQIAIPWYNGGTTLGFYNTELLSAAGFDPSAPPTSYEDALALAGAYHAATGAYATNFMAYSNVVQAYDIPLLSDDGRSAAFNTDDTVALLESFKSAFDAAAIAPGSLSADQRNLPQSLENEQIAFDPVATSSRLLNIEKNAPAVYDKIAVAPPVAGPSGSYYMPNQQIFGIPLGSDNQAAAAEWLKFVTSAENQLAFCKLVAIYPSAVDAVQDPFFTDVDADGPAGQARAVLRDTFADSVDASLGSGNDEQLRQLFDEQVRAFMAGEKSAQDALDAAEAGWNDLLAKER